VLQLLLAILIPMNSGIPGDNQAGIREISCGAIDSYTGRAINLGRYSVMRETLADGPLSLQFDGDFDINALTCRRSTSVPQPNDYKVAVAGLILFIDSRRRGEAVRTALYVENDQFVLQILEGRLTDSERALTLGRIQGYYNAVNIDSADTALDNENSTSTDIAPESLSGPDAPHLCDRSVSRDGPSRGHTRGQSCRSTSRRLAPDPSGHSDFFTEWF
jgi:hypothetical protein